MILKVVEFVYLEFYHHNSNATLKITIQRQHWIWFWCHNLQFLSLCVCFRSSFVYYIDNCVFIDNTGNSIVYVAMEYYAMPAFVILNGDFMNNTGIPLKLLNVILLGEGSSIFQHNQANIGAALYLSDSYILLNYTPRFSLI